MNQWKYTVDVMAILVKNKSKVNTIEQLGRTPLHLAANGETEWTASIVEYLREQQTVVELLVFRFFLFQLNMQNKMAIHSSKFLEYFAK